MKGTIDLSGKWSIDVNQPFEGKTISYTIEGELLQSFNKILGNMVFDLSKLKFDLKSRLGNEKELVLSLSGIITYDHLHLKYYNVKKDIAQFGSGLLAIQNQSTLDGMFMGYSLENNGIIQGSMVWSR